MGDPSTGDTQYTLMTIKRCRIAIVALMYSFLKHLRATWFAEIALVYTFQKQWHATVALV